MGVKNGGVKLQLNAGSKTDLNFTTETLLRTLVCTIKNAKYLIIKNNFVKSHYL
jgi:hypothetical protein